MFCCVLGTIVALYCTMFCGVLRTLVALYCTMFYGVLGSVVALYFTFFCSMFNGVLGSLVALVCCQCQVRWWHCITLCFAGFFRYQGGVLYYIVRCLSEGYKPKTVHSVRERT